jgi:Zn-dependent peptidase ImmA (M78 family)
MQPENPENVPFLTRQEIEDRAKAVLMEHGLLSIPVDPVVLANRLGIRVNNAKFSDDSMVGMIAKRGDNVTLLVNQGDPPFRKRFTIAHELGHHFLHLLQDGEFVDGEADLFRQQWEESAAMTPQRRREIQANMFASSLLMPEQEVRREWPSFRSVSGMARRFNVSEAAMGIRIDQLGLN